MTDEYEGPGPQSSPSPSDEIETPGPDADELFQGVDEGVLMSADELRSDGDLTMRQAVAWLLRDVEDVDRPEAAEQMGLSKSAMDTHLGAARRKIEEARATVETVELLQERHTGEQESWDQEADR